MTLVVVGDIHGFWEHLRSVHDQALQLAERPAAIIQVGDFGFSIRQLVEIRNSTWVPEIPIYAIDGNHEEFPILRGWGQKLYEFHRNMWYVPRGMVLELDGKRVGFLGGAGSIDKKLRLSIGWPWYPEEELTSIEAEILVKQGPVDLMVTHGPPQSVVDEHFDPRGKLAFGVPLDWEDPSLSRVQWAWEQLGKPPLVCGHMHRSVEAGPVRILAENEVVIVT